jgi:hypothetical protein
MCERLKDFIIINLDNGERAVPNCKAYSCPECGPKKVAKLKYCIYEELQKWNQVRLWTFTLSFNVGGTIEKHYKILQECWRRLNIYMRRNKSITKDQRQYRYIKLIEEHKSGYIHFHVLLDKFLPQKIVQTCWENIIQDITKTNRHTGQVWVKGNLTPENGAYYVTKYVSKAIKDIGIKARRYSVSIDGKLFPTKEKDGTWIFFHYRKNLHDVSTEIISLGFPSLVLFEHNFTINKNYDINLTGKIFECIKEQNST